MNKKTKTLAIRPTTEGPSVVPPLKKREKVELMARRAYEQQQKELEPLRKRRTKLENARKQAVQKIVANIPGAKLLSYHNVNYEEAANEIEIHLTAPKSPQLRAVQKALEKVTNDWPHERPLDFFRKQFSVELDNARVNVLMNNTEAVKEIDAAIEALRNLKAIPA